MRRARGAQLGALIAIIDALETRRLGVTLRELAELTGLNERSVRRYLDELQPPFMDVEVVREGAPARWRCKRSGRTTRMGISASECLALARIRAATLQLWRGAPWLETLRQAFERIEANIPAAFLALFEASEEVNDAAPIYPLAAERWREEFEEAARERKVMVLRYHGMSGNAVRRYDPYMIYVSDGATYAYGHDHKSGEGRILALDRVDLVRVTSEVFERPTEFSATTFVADLHHGYKRVAPIEVAVVVQGRAARLWRDRPEAADQSVEQLNDKSLRIRFTAPMSPALVARLLSFGAELEVESPPEVRGAMVEQLGLALKAYAAVPSRRRKILAVGRRGRGLRRA